MEHTRPAPTRRGAVLTVATVCLAGGVLAGTAPTDNPVAAYYSGHEGYPAWTDAIRWENVVDMSAYARGKTNFEKFENARDELAAQGGGVLYYPAGTYEFADGPFDGPAGRGLMLRSGVVVRGETPGGPSTASTRSTGSGQAGSGQAGSGSGGRPNAFRDGKLELKTRFVFGFRKWTVTRDGVAEERETPRDWNLIGLQPETGKGVGDVHNVGICWVHVDGAVLFWGPQLAWNPTWKEGKSWKSAYAKESWQGRKPDGTHPTDAFMGAPGPGDGGEYRGAGRGRLVFGCAFVRSALLNDYDTCGRAESSGGFGTNGFHMAKFAARVGVYGSRILIANNWLPQSEKGNFLYEQTTAQTAPGPRGGNSFRILGTRTSTVMWDYGRTMGVDVNKDMLSMVRSAILDKPEGGYWGEGVVVADNGVFNHGHKGFNLSGNWVTVRDNRNERAFLRSGDDIYGAGAAWRLTLDGFIEAHAGGGGMISDNLARAFDLSGWNVWVDGNTFRNTGSQPGNDGEGILCQAHGGTHIWSWALTHNVNEGSEGGAGKGFMGGWAVDCLGLLVGWNKTSSYVGTQYSAGNRLADMAIVKNQAGSIRPDLAATKGNPKNDGTGVPILDTTGIPAAPADVRAEIYGGDAVQVTWKDASDNEAAFRVERSMDGGQTWRVIAYRPPRIEGHEKNAQAWVDFLAPPGKPLVYRVTAVGADETVVGAGKPAGAVTLSTPDKRKR